MFKDIMVDLETMATGSNASIVQFGAVEFDRNTGLTGRRFKHNVSLESCIVAGLRVDGNTVEWWMTKPDNQRLNLYDPKPFLLGVVLVKFNEWLMDSPAGSANLHLWGRSPRFDIAILADAYKAMNLLVIWNFRNEMCVRTIEALEPGIKAVMDVQNSNANSHDVIDDCLHQIGYCSAIWQTIKKPF